MKKYKVVVNPRLDKKNVLETILVHARDRAEALKKARREYVTKQDVNLDVVYEAKVLAE